MGLLELLEDRGFLFSGSQRDLTESFDEFRNGQVVVKVYYYEPIVDGKRVIIDAKLSVEPNDGFDIMGNLDDVLELFGNYK